MDEDEEMVYVPLDSDNVCKFCDAEFLDEEDLNVHCYTVHATFGVHCQFCTCISPSLEDYAGHIIDVHILSIKLCQFCNKAFVIHEDLVKHELKHVIKKDSKINKCSSCSVKFMYKYDLQNHEYVSHKDSGEGVFLNNVFPLLSSRLCFNALTFLQSMGKEYHYKCIVCKIKTHKVEYYLKHLKESYCKPLVCNHCSNVYKAKIYLMEHLNSHQECNHFNTKLKLTCNRCWLEFDGADYRKHVKSCDILKCKICKNVYTDVHKLYEHQSTMHPMSIQMHLCKFCQKEFVGTVALNKHVARCHQDLHLYKYRCIWCKERYFKHPQKLFAHFYSKHYSLNAFDCKICKLQFRIRKKFTLHIKLKHNSKGFVEFNKDYTVFFTDTKSTNPFQPTSFFPSLLKENANDNKDNVINIDQLDDPTDYTTDAQTESELSKVIKTKKPLKLRFKKNNSHLQLTTDENATDTNAKENETNGNKEIKSETNRKANSGYFSDSDDQPLLVVKKQMKKKRGKYKKKGSKKAFTCNICEKFCYTYNNYNLHMSMHSNDEKKKCIKCNKEFSSKAKLNKHMSEAHKTSKLTETLKSILLRRKLGIKKKETEVSVGDKIKSTIKKVKVSSVTPQAEIKEVKENLSVQKYIESFVPEEMGKKVDMKSCVSISLVDGAGARPPKIKMTKFTPKPVPSGPPKLSLPVKFKNDRNTEKTTVKVSLVQTAEPEEKYYENDIVTDNDFNDHTDYNEDYQKTESIPEVAQEVMLESQETRSIPQSIVIPKLPKDVDANDVKIAHLLPEAPFYKIVKMKDILNQSNKINDDKTVPETIKLPSGKKLVNVNPLAHLIGNAKIKELVGTRKDSKNETDFKAAIAKALMRLDKPSSPKPKSKTKSKKKSVKNNEEANEAVAIEQ